MARKVIVVMCFVFLGFAGISYAGFLDDLLKAGTSLKQENDVATIASGLKEALSIGSNNAVKSVSKLDGYFGNELIKILMPEKIKKLADVLKKVGFGKQVDEFVLSMNRAAEKAAPQALSYFVDAIKEMSFEDAKAILNGGDSSATQFFKNKTQAKIEKAFKPIITESLNSVGATKYYKDMVSKYESIPFVEKQSVDLDSYVTNKALDGLFLTLGQEEKKIRTDPAARVTDLLKKVFTK